MITISDKATLYWNIQPSYLVKANEGQLTDQFRFIGTSVTAVRNILSKDALLKAVMPTIIGLSPNDPNWAKMLDEYWNSVSIPISKGGKDFELGFHYHVADPRFRENIALLGKTVNKSFDTDEALADYLHSRKNGTYNVPLHLRFMYGEPINPLDYIVRVYTDKLKTVANHFNDIDKSSDILFYFTTEADKQEALVKQTDLMIKSTSEFIRVVGDLDEVERLLINLLNNPFEINAYSTSSLRIQRLKRFSEDEPIRFLKVTRDKSNTTKAFINKLILTGILKVVDGSSIITDANDPNKVIGGDLLKAVEFFEHKANAATVSDYTIRYKANTEK